MARRVNLALKHDRRQSRPMTRVMMFLVAYGLMALGVLGTLANYQLLYRSWSRGEHTSLIPLLGGASLCFGMWLHPNDALTNWCWIPLLTDIATGPLLIATAIAALRHSDEVV